MVGGDILPVEEETFETGDMPGTEGATETETGSNEEGSSVEEEGQDEEAREKEIMRENQ